MKKYLNDVFLLSVLMPFVSPYPASTDLQPLGLFLGACLVIVRFSLLRVDIQFFVYFLWLFISSIYVLAGLDTKLSVTIIAIIVYSLAFKAADFDRFLYLVKLSILINFLVLCLQIVAGDLFNPVIEQLVRTVKVTDYTGARGATGLASEPGFTGALMVFYWLLIFHYFRIGSLKPHSFLSYTLIILVCISLTKSGSGALFFLVALLGVAVSFLSVRYFITVFVCSALIYATLLVVLNEPSLSGRFWQILKVLIYDPSSLPTLDTSIGHRYSNIVLGVLSLGAFPLGGVTYEFALARFYNDPLLASIPGSKSNISAFSFMAVSLGYVYLVPFFLLIVSSLYKSFRFLVPFLSVTFLFVLASFSPAFPLVWLVLSSKFKDIRCAG